MLFTPQSLWKEGETYGTLQLPGINGGATGADRAPIPKPGYLYVPSRSGLTMMVLADGQAELHRFSVRARTASSAPRVTIRRSRRSRTARKDCRYQAAVQPNDRVRFEYAVTSRGRCRRVPGLTAFAIIRR